MYYPIGWPRKLNFRFRSKCSTSEPKFDETSGLTEKLNGVSLENGHEEEEIPEEMVQIVANTDKSLFVVLTTTSVHVWCSKPPIEIVNHSRNKGSLETLGHNICVNWKPDSTVLVIQTSKHFLLFYKVAIKDSPEYVYEQVHINSSDHARDSNQFSPNKIPSLYLFLTFSTQISPGIASLLAAEEEIVVATNNGMVIGVNWNGTLDPGLQWQISSSIELNIVDIKYSSMIGGFSLVFANGKVGFTPLQADSSQAQTSALSFAPSKVQFVSEIENGVTSAINHKYQIIAFGLKNAEGVLCCIDVENSTVNATHRIVLPSSKFPNIASSVGSITCLQWSPDSTVLACSWERGGIALWSVFGALLMCSLSWDSYVDSMKAENFIVSSIAWGKEGYQLWLLATTPSNNGHPPCHSLMQMSMAKSVLASNPSSVSCCEESLVLISDDRIYLGVSSENEARNTNQNRNDDGNEELPSTNALSSRMQWKQQPSEVGNHQWIIIQIPESYLTSNWPIRLAAIDSNGRHLAISGRTGMAHYSLLTRKWKLFGNETQERDFEVCGGLLWWDSYIVLSCYNVVESRFEIRAYPHNTRLDNQFVRVAKVPAEVLVMSIYKNKLLALLLDGTMLLYGFHQKRLSSANSPSNSYSLHLLQLNQIVVNNLAVPPECVTSILLTSLHHETKPNSEASESILMNVCGRLFFLERENSLETPQDTSTVSAEDSNSTVMYKAVSILASGVENVWVSQTDNKADRPHLTDALWISRGCYGMNVWLPLLPNLSEKAFPRSNAHNFMSKRIMLPINTHIYPLAVLFRDAVVIGAENDTLNWGKSCPVSLPFSVISRTSQVYLHHILRELLKKNLGIHAWEIANSCVSLPYFPHSLELLLHETLEEEATSSQPIPDALLPRVVDFIREFPVFLETIVHCARKTELALWPHLFAVVGNPKTLFETCLDNDQLETAASYLLVLQNLERTSVSRKYATLLMDAAKKSSRTRLASDLTRFLQAIDPTDYENPNPKPTIPPSASATNPHSMKYFVSPAIVTEIDGHVHQLAPGRKRTISTSNSLMLHSATNGSVPNSPDAASATLSHNLTSAASAVKREESHTLNNVVNGGAQLIQSPVTVTSTKVSGANGLSKKEPPAPVMNGSHPVVTDDDSQSASQCKIS
ncbi:Guanine nucleotide exchange factor subunit RIC1 [Halotydeus destructor]|nr:Guanine nucleotide exchange factor subunit RIC1 [Halotydeus destructor]